MKIGIQKIIDLTVGEIFCFLGGIKKRKDGLGKPQRITFLRLNAIGDSILCLPIIKKAKEQTGAKITVVCSKANLAVFEGHDFIDDIIIFQDKTLSPLKVLNSGREIYNQNPDWVIDTSQSMNFSAFLSKTASKYNSGFSGGSKFRKRNYQSLVKLGRKEHLIKKLRELIDPINLEKEEKLELIPPKYGEKERKSIESALPQPRNLVGIHAQSHESSRVWPADRWAKVIDHLTEKGYRPVMIGSPNEREISNKIMSNVNNKQNVFDFVGKTSIKETFALMDKLDFFIGVDGGPMHVAASFDIPVLGIFGPDTPKKYAPFNSKSLSIFKGEDDEHSFSKGKKRLQNTKVEEVKDAIDKIEKNVKTKK